MKFRVLLLLSCAAVATSLHAQTPVPAPPAVVQASPSASPQPAAATQPAPAVQPAAPVVIQPAAIPAATPAGPLPVVAAPQPVQPAATPQATSAAAATSPGDPVNITFPRTSVFEVLSFY